jgi:hypothetical protein
MLNQERKVMSGTGNTWCINVVNWALNFKLKSKASIFKLMLLKLNAIYS